MGHGRSSRIVDNRARCVTQYVMDRKESETKMTTKNKRLWRVVEVRRYELPFEDLFSIRRAVTLDEYRIRQASFPTAQK